MKREIKYKAWHKRHKEMYFLSGFDKYGDGWSGGNPEHKFLEIYLIPKGFMKVSFDEVELIEFTGLKDKNGKEIYEGDIVTGSSNGILDEIIFSEGCFCLKNAWIAYEATYWGDEIEVKGNIYETPELLSEQV